MRVICAAAMMVLLSGPAFAQFAPGEHMQQAGEADKDKTHSQIESEKAAKRATKGRSATFPTKHRRIHGAPSAMMPRPKPLPRRRSHGSRIRKAVRGLAQ